MDNFLYDDKKPSTIIYKDTAVSKLYFNDVLVWEADCDCDCDCDCDNDCDCTDGE